MNLLAALYTDCNLTSQRCFQIEELEVVRPLTLPERAVALALAVSLDSDYFSRRGGWYAYVASVFQLTYPYGGVVFIIAYMCSETD
jgi:hypothetical protein